MTSRKSQRLIKTMTLLCTVVLGTLGGFFVGREAILHAQESRLSGFADALEQHEEDLASEIASTLSQANQSTAPPCSDQDMALLRRLTFSARFLKDVGRIQNNALVCSSAIGNLAQPEPMLGPDISLPTGSVIYRSYPVHEPAGERAEVVALRDADVVVSPDVFADFPQYPFHYSVGVIDRTRGIVQSARNGTTQFPRALLAGPHRVLDNGTIYVARYSGTYPVGTVAYIHLSDLWRANRRLLAGYMLTGTVAGSACGFALVLVGRKRSSHSNQLRRAVLTGNLQVAYQPIVELSTHRIVGAEALARWTDEDGDSIRPEIVVGLAETEGFISEVTRFVVTRSLEELGPLLEAQPSFRLNINLAPSDLADPRLLILLDEMLQSSIMTPANIAFELPERATSDKEVAVAAIRRLRDRGHAIFIDDFGTGYSNLTFLSELNVDGIKINRSFIATIGTESVTASIVPQILAVASALSLSVVVQGIEREEQVSYFSGGDPKILGQGWFLGLPVSARTLRYLCAERTE